ncbi:unnamed protein product [Closterium sp. NIES-53]
MGVRVVGETPTPQQLREWFSQRGASGGSVRCPYVIRTGEPRGAKSEGAESGGAEPGGTKPGVTEHEGAGPGGAESGDAEPRGVEMPKLEALPLEALELEVLELLLELGVPELELLEAMELETLELETLALEALELEDLELEALELEALELEALAVEALELEALELETLELETLALEALELDELELDAQALELETLELQVLALGVQELAVLVLSLPSSTGLTPPLLCPLSHLSQPQLQPDSPLPAPSPYAEQTDSPSEHCEPASRPASPVCVVRIGHHVPRPRTPPVPGTHVMALRPSFVPLPVPLPSPPVSSLPGVPDPKSDLARATIPTVPCLLSSIITDPSFESTVASALVAELVDFAAACRLDYATSLVAESESDCPPSIGGECALGMDVLEDGQQDFECLAAAVPHLVAMLLARKGDLDTLDIPNSRSYAKAITGPYSS